MNQYVRISIQKENFNVNSEIELLRTDQMTTGSIAVFLGLVRDLSENKDLKFIELEHYPGMAERALKEICLEASRRWEVNGITVIHRFGRLKPGENIVLVLVSSKHRAEAYCTNEFIMDFLKSGVPFWKKETDNFGSSWVRSRSSDIKAVSRWNES
tara:strand:+ start:469 stop:936 length:468 start_codon:yes stop_codon:yes gene_type:complete